MYWPGLNMKVRITELAGICSGFQPLIHVLRFYRARCAQPSPAQLGRVCGAGGEYDQHIVNTASLDCRSGEMRAGTLCRVQWVVSPNARCLVTGYGGTLEMVSGRHSPAQPAQPSPASPAQPSRAEPRMVICSTPPLRII